MTEVAVPGWEAVGNMTQTLRVYQGSPQVTVSFTNQPTPTPEGEAAVNDAMIEIERGDLKRHTSNLEILLAQVRDSA